MTGNSKRRGAVRGPGSKKGAIVGSGGRGRRALEGRGPTPKAEERVGHPARAKAQARAVADGRRPTNRQRARTQSEVVAGRNPVLEALRAGVPAEGLRVFTRIEADERVREIIGLAVAAGLEVKELSKPDLDALTGGAVHQGLALVVTPFAYVDLRDLIDKGSTPLIVALDGIQDPRNLGAILRSAAAFGASGVVIPERRAASVTVSAWKASVGAAARTPVARVTNLPRAIHELKAEGCFVVGLDAHGEVPLGECPLLGEPLVIAVGSEGKGLSRLTREECDQVLSIPISASTESLNASVAASLALYEVARVRNTAT
ncbi:MAG: 23S rRNA (guanosine(2251)-2'-O)-methyltransferase RlmB [Demequinaceae bacterium]|nr:23S rRNA (guanosine(2251)-2'-O)-methyltransferase RlmB [Demequinaceae bacterium]